MGYFDPVLSSMPEGWQSTLLSLPENVQKYFMENAQQMAADPMGTAKAVGTGFAKGATTDLAGLPVDTGVNLYNLGKAGAGYVGSKLGMPASSLPQMTENKDVMGSSEWLAGKVREAGAGPLIDPPQGTSELANLFGSVVAPGPKGTKGVKKSELFAGIESKTADLPALRNALAYSKEGVNMDTVRDLTGWFRDKGGKWQYEISDKEAKFTPMAEHVRQLEAHSQKSNTVDQAIWLRSQMNNGVTLEDAKKGYATTFQRPWVENQEAVDMARSSPLWNLQDKARYLVQDTPDIRNMKAKLGDVLEHPELFKAYPELKNMPFEFKHSSELGLGVRGAYSPLGIDLLESLHKDVHTGKGVLTHEVQHAIQRLEGFARGGSSTEFGEHAAPFIKQQIATIKNALVDEHKRLMEAGQHDKAMEVARRVRDFHPDMIYARLLGEAQARAAQKRIDMTMAERRDTRIKDIYDVPESKLLVRPSR